GGPIGRRGAARGGGGGRGRRAPARGGGVDGCAEAAEALAGGGAPGRRWRLLYVAGAGDVSKARKALQGLGSGGAAGQYVDGLVSAVQRFDAASEENENGIFGGKLKESLEMTIVVAIGGGELLEELRTAKEIQGAPAPTGRTWAPRGQSTEAADGGTEALWDRWSPQGHGDEGGKQGARAERGQWQQEPWWSQPGWGQPGWGQPSWSQPGWSSGSGWDAASSWWQGQEGWAAQDQVSSAPEPEQGGGLAQGAPHARTALSRAAVAFEPEEPPGPAAATAAGPAQEHAAEPAVAAAPAAGSRGEGAQSREEMKQALFGRLDANGDGLLLSPELWPYAVKTGFDGSEAEWAEEYAMLCRDMGRHVAEGLSALDFFKMLDDDSAEGCYCDDEELRSLLVEIAEPTAVPDHAAGQEAPRESSKEEEVQSREEMKQTLFRRLDTNS
ncbi:unnamed protein product, partial [Prorocentrum cordatum]